ncbi:hypothetical protein R1sor_027478 [Riccia sorocarpa]|uniref:MPN domain-containing protein n=1 Tax=Riccia sorocarpa TaxID=122646 RepID=A0ABD3GHL7_9MARC
MTGTVLIVAEKAARLDVDHRLPLRIYYRAADSILRQAAIYRKEHNLIDLYVLLLRFSSLVMETIPQHRDYRTFYGREKQDFRKRVLDILNELEALKPRVQAEVERINSSHRVRAPLSITSSAVSATVAAPSATPFYRSQTFSGASAVKNPYQSQSWTADYSSRPVEQRRQEYPQLEYGQTGESSGRFYDNALVGSSWNDGGGQGGQEITGSAYPFAGDQGRQSFGVQRHEFSQASSTLIENGNFRPLEVQSQYAPIGSVLSQSATHLPFSAGSVYPNFAPSASLVDSMQNLSLSIPSARTETLSRHSFLGSTTVRRTSASHYLPTKVAYPSLIDTSPVTIPSLDQSWRAPTALTTPPVLDANSSSCLNRASLQPSDFIQLEERQPTLQQTDLIKLEQRQSSLVQTTVVAHSPLVRQPTPPPVQVEVETITATLEKELGCPEAHPAETVQSEPKPEPEVFELPEVLTRPRKPKPLHLSHKLMDEFMAVAKGNTKNNLETCGVLAGALKEGMFYVTTVIIPKQEATANSCSTTNEEELFEYQDKNELFQFGWIHTHPSQSCFMSSIDLHTHYSYQIMLPEAIAIVMAPTDSSRKYGMFRLSEPSGLKTIQSCEKRGFHPHDQPSDGSPIYESSYHVHLNSKVSCTVVDLR